MNKIYTVKPIDTITLNFEDGASIVLRFDTKAIYHLTKDYDLKKLFKSGNPEEICGAIIYSASVEQSDDMTKERALWIENNIHPTMLQNITNDCLESLGTDMKEEQKKTMQEFLEKILN